MKRSGTDAKKVAGSLPARAKADAGHGVASPVSAPVGGTGRGMGGPPELAISDFRELAHYIERTLGIRMPDSKMALVQSRLWSRLRERGLDNYHDYVELLMRSKGDAGTDELVAFLDLITTNKTSFFREAEHFSALCDIVLPQVATGRKNQPVSVWSAACSSGQEVYTLAMVIADFLSAWGEPGSDFQILGTDVSTRVLAQARAAVYPSADVEPVPDKLRRTYLLRSKDASRNVVRVVPGLRSRTKFERLNFRDAEYRVRGPFDIIFCRNVLIYFDEAMRQEVVGKLAGHLVPGGFLFLGMAENLRTHALPLTSLGRCIFQRA